MGLMDQFKAKAEELAEQLKVAFGEVAKPKEEADKTKEAPKEGGGPASGTSERETEGPW